MGKAATGCLETLKHARHPPALEFESMGTVSRHPNRRCPPSPLGWSAHCTGGVQSQKGRGSLHRWFANNQRKNKAMQQKAQSTSTHGRIYGCLFSLQYEHIDENNSAIGREGKPQAIIDENFGLDTGKKWVAVFMLWSWSAVRTELCVAAYISLGAHSYNAHGTRREKWADVRRSPILLHIRRQNRPKINGCMPIVAGTPPRAGG
jgi:hypothetical protein